MKPLIKAYHLFGSAPDSLYQITLSGRLEYYQRSVVQNNLSALMAHIRAQFNAGRRRYLGFFGNQLSIHFIVDEMDKQRQHESSKDYKELWNRF